MMGYIHVWLTGLLLHKHFSAVGFLLDRESTLDILYNLTYEAVSFFSYTLDPTNMSC